MHPSPVSENSTVSAATRIGGILFAMLEEGIDVELELRSGRRISLNFREVIPSMRGIALLSLTQEPGADLDSIPWMALSISPKYDPSILQITEMRVVGEPLAISSPKHVHPTLFHPIELVYRDRSVETWYWQGDDIHGMSIHGALSSPATIPIKTIRSLRLCPQTTSQPDVRATVDSTTSPPEHKSDRAFRPDSLRVPATPHVSNQELGCEPPPPFDGDGGFVFVSYKREDLPRITPYLHRLVGWGYKLWYDRGIPGGAEWDAMIEDKVSRCMLLLTFMSCAAVNSKWVRREIKFADSQNKPILAVRLEPVELNRGLNIVLSQYQMIDASRADFSDELRKAIEYVRLL